MDHGEIVILEEVSMASQTELRETARIVHEGCCAVSFGPKGRWPPAGISM